MSLANLKITLARPKPWELAPREVHLGAALASKALFLEMSGISHSANVIQLRPQTKLLTQRVSKSWFLQSGAQMLP